MIALKPGVKLTDLQPQIVLALQIAEGLWAKYGQPTLVVTSCNDSKHIAGSLHYTGRAVDLRIKSIPSANREKLVIDLDNAFGGDSSEFDVLWENQGTMNEHLHIEHDP